MNVLNDFIVVFIREVCYNIGIQENNMKKDIEKKVEALRLDKGVGIKDGPIEGTCFINGEWSTTVFEFIDTLIGHPITYKEMPSWHEDFIMEPTVNALFEEIKADWTFKD
jgi:hypothetical protein